MVCKSGTCVTKSSLNIPECEVDTCQNGFECVKDSFFVTTTTITSTTILAKTTEVIATTLISSITTSTMTSTTVTITEALKQINSIKTNPTTVLSIANLKTNTLIKSISNYFTSSFVTTTTSKKTINPETSTCPRK
jgi:hypothetical protein